MSVIRERLYVHHVEHQNFTSVFFSPRETLRLLQLGVSCITCGLVGIALSNIDYKVLSGRMNKRKVFQKCGNGWVGGGLVQASVGWLPGDTAMDRHWQGNILFAWTQKPRNLD